MNKSICFKYSIGNRVRVSSEGTDFGRFNHANGTITDRFPRGEMEETENVYMIEYDKPFPAARGMFPEYVLIPIPENEDFELRV